MTNRPSCCLVNRRAPQWCFRRSPWRVRQQHSKRLFPSSHHNPCDNLFVARRSSTKHSIVPATLVGLAYRVDEKQRHLRIHWEGSCLNDWTVLHRFRRTSVQSHDIHDVAWRYDCCKVAQCMDDDGGWEVGNLEVGRWSTFHIVHCRQPRSTPRNISSVSNTFYCAKDCRYKTSTQGGLSHED